VDDEVAVVGISRNARRQDRTELLGEREYQLLDRQHECFLRPAGQTDSSVNCGLVGLPPRCYCDWMTFKARVKAGRLVVDEPTDLPEGTEVELLPLDPGDWLDLEERVALHQALKDSDEDVKSGRLVDADVVLRDLRSR
jgi:hypothetical protein